MSDLVSRLPARPSLEQLRKQSKDLLRQFRSGDPAAIERFRVHFPKAASAAANFQSSLANAQFVIAREHGFENWAKLKQHVETLPLESLKRYEELARDVLQAYRTGESGAMQRVWAASGHMRSWKAMRKYMQLDLGKRPKSESDDVEISIDDARLIVARGHGFENWQKLVEYAGTLTPGKMVAAKPVTLFSIDSSGSEQTATTERDWDAVIALMKDQKLAGLNAEGQMTDAVLERISQLDHVTALYLESSAQLTDSGLRYLSRMPQLQRLNLSGCPISDRGLEVLRELPDLRRFSMFHQGGISDAGMANVANCHKLEHVDLMNTTTGDGTIRALAGKSKLRYFKGGNFVTDAGIELLHEFPAFKSWQGGKINMSLTSAEAQPNFLWLYLKAPYLNSGISKLKGLDGLFALSIHGGTEYGPFDSRDTVVERADLEPLADLSNLGWLGCAGDLCDDAAMRHIGALPRLRMLMAQGAVATDEGFAALSRSSTIERIWGREWPNLTSRGFVALSAMPALAALAVSCKNVDDAGLSALPRFRTLKELMPMDVPDDGYRHIGRCEQLESLILMYCRETTDVATSHIASLRNLKKYFASYTKITDRSLEILGRMVSLEKIEIYGCAGLTNTGVAALAGLPRLQELNISGQQLTPDCLKGFPATVRVNFSTW